MSDEEDFDGNDSLELIDAVVDNDYFNDASSIVNVFNSNDDNNKNGWFSRYWQNRKDRKWLERIKKHETDDLKMFVAQKIFKMDSILCDEETRLQALSTCLFQEPTDDDQLERRYGRDMANWLKDTLLPSFADCSAVLRSAFATYNMYKKVDPLCNWFYDPPEVSSQVASRIAKFVDHMTAKVRWSLLIEPGHLSCHLTELLSDFRRLEMISTKELSHDETSQTVFNDNYITKARNRTIPCYDRTRVVLSSSSQNKTQKKTSVVNAIFEGEQEVEEKDDEDAYEPYGTQDFIHASYVRGGPLLNTFICTQAPMENTQYDFWRMVCQEKSTFIVMLCAAVDTKDMGVIGQLKETSYCSYYWPRYENESMQLLDITIRNKRVDCTTDPLFTITHLEVTYGDGETLQLEHWRWDWQYLGDYYWPFRVLRRARLLSAPTIVHCMDGCTKSGTLVAIETVLMHFLRGTPLDENVVLLSALFVRLHRHLSVGSPLLYLYIYRCVLHWISPYVASSYQQLALGLQYRSFGFIPTYEELIRGHTI